MKSKLVVAVTLTLALTNAHAANQSAKRGNHAIGPHAGLASAASANSTSPNGVSAYSNGATNNGGAAWVVVGDSLADPYQPFAERDMRQYQKPHWVVWDGK